MRASPGHRAPVADRAEAKLGAIMVVESTPHIGFEAVEQLCADGYHAIHAQSAGHARALAGDHRLRAIVLGGLDTSRAPLSLLGEIRRCIDGDGVWDAYIPAIVVGPGIEELDLLRAFEAGADDFVVSFARYLELRARLKAVLRRAEHPGSSRLLRVGALSIDTVAHTVSVGGSPLELCRLEYELLIHLARRPTRAFSKQELLKEIWGYGDQVGARTLGSHASRLRRKLDAAGASGLVVNVWGVGYRLI